ncbi:Uncharacterised protein [Moraxella cuniculi]|uniref:Uncharacterized protein n=2 Tax=Moraxella cuniculi TaxID=34061 RepID=A0A448GUF0_9GAMM|nr:Uncharacterised protein [Moraxella cuniculi]
MAASHASKPPSGLKIIRLAFDYRCLVNVALFVKLTYANTLFGLRNHRIFDNKGALIKPFWQLLLNQAWRRLMMADLDWFIAFELFVSTKQCDYLSNNPSCIKISEL